MIKNRILWLLWLVCMAGAAVITGTWLFAAVLLLSALLLIFSAGSVALSGKKAVIKLHLPKAAERMGRFDGEIRMENQSAWPVFGGAGVLRWENLFTGEKERSLFPFPWEERKNRSSGLRPEAAGAAASDFVFLTGNARIFFVSFL